MEDNALSIQNTRNDHESVFRPRNKKNDRLESEEMKTNALVFCGHRGCCQRDWWWW